MYYVKVHATRPCIKFTLDNFKKISVGDTISIF
ncbi:hypothetical protein SAMN05421769_2805 [Chryseobacterium scophthalmum]|uniref:Uncharacterized protein n=1 Tax=Chryseobacterium scophthalmum TaxID=59733 RepID=A0A1N6HST3_9FLAO|nr:hypothetical protein SAMN05421769_2805 [Chryseobacterium scophthalmum]